MIASVDDIDQNVGVEWRRLLNECSILMNRYLERGNEWLVVEHVTLRALLPLFFFSYFLPRFLCEMIEFCDDLKNVRKYKVNQSMEED